jgi:hypothetical protein
MKNVIKNTRLLLFGPIFALALSACSPEVPVGEAEYPTKIVGDWQGRVGGTNETISFGADGTFVSQVRRSGFISDTLSQGLTDTIRGTWAIKGKFISFNITSSEDVRVLNKVATSTIETFRTNELVVKSSNGSTATFVR